MRHSVDVSFECSIDYVSSNVNHVWHDRLVLRTIPRDVSGLSHSISVGILVVLMEDWSLSGSPLSVGIRDGWVSWNHSGHVPIEEVWVVGQGFGVDVLIIKNDGSVKSQTSS